MIITRTPYRISFFGGGTDYPIWYRKHGGAVLSASIDKYCTLTVRHLPPFFEHRIRVVYSQIETCQTVDDIQHPAVRETLRCLNITYGVEIHHDGDLPAYSGIGSSSSFTVGLLNALSALQGRLLSKQQLAAESIHLEQDVFKETVGSQDQVSAAYGGLNYIDFMRDGAIEVQPVDVSDERLHELERHLLLIYTRSQRIADTITRSYVPQLNEKTADLSVLYRMAQDGRDLLCGDYPLRDFSELLHEAWTIKKRLGGKISTPEIDRLYQQALAAGAVGGKITGAGGGGFMLLFAPENRHSDIIQAMPDVLHVPFKFDSFGSRIVLNEQTTEPAPVVPDIQP